MKGGNQAVSFLSIALLRWAVTVAWKKLHFSDHLNPKKEPLWKIEALFLYSAFPVFTRILNAFVRATKSKIHLHCVALHSEVFSLSPYDFSAVAPMTSSWGLLHCVLHYNKERCAAFYSFSNKRSKYFTSLRKSYVLFPSFGC